MAYDEVELHFFSLVQSPESFARYCCIVNKNVFSILSRNESVSLLGIKPFDNTVSHFLLLDDYWSDGITCDVMVSRKGISGGIRYDSVFFSRASGGFFNSQTSKMSADKHNRKSEQRVI